MLYNPIHENECESILKEAERQLHVNSHVRSNVSRSGINHKIENIDFRTLNRQL